MLTGELHPHITNASARLDVALPALERAADFSVQQLRAARSFFKERLAWGDPLDIVVCGSMARQEMSGASDFDYLIVAHGLVEDATKFRAFRRACDDWCTQRAIKPPGPTGIFGKVVSATELVEQIGLEFDTNASLTRRILLLEEGASTLDPKLHRKFVRVALGRYLEGDHLDDAGVPRFLLNDISRYWRTIAVDYQAKVWQRVTTAGWGLRYLKLRVSRKLTFAASVASLLLVATRRPEDRREFLTAQFVDLPPLARLAQLTQELDGDANALKHLAEILRIADGFVDFVSDDERRTAVDSIESPVLARRDPEFLRVQEQSSDLQRHLEGLLLDSHAFGRLGRKYLTF